MKNFRCNLTFFDSLFFVLGWSLLTLITFGLAAPFFIFSLIKYIINKSVLVDNGVENPLVCTMRIGADFMFLIGWSILTLITCGLASPFFAFSLIKYAINKTEVNLPRKISM